MEKLHPGTSAALLASAAGYEILAFVMVLRVYDITGRALDVGVFTALTFLPKIPSPYYGELVDRFGAARALAFAAACVAGLSMGLVLARSLFALCALWLVLSAFFMLIGNARSVLIAEAGGGAGAARGNALLLSFLSGARLVAPLAAGFALRAAGSGPIILGAAAAYACCAVAALGSTGAGRSGIVGGTCRGTGRGTGAGRTGAGGEPRRPRASGRGRALREGLRLVLRSKPLRTMTAIGILWRLCVGMQASLLVVYIAGLPGRSSADYGAAVAAAAAGGFAGSFSGPFLLKAAGARRLAGAGLGLHFLCFAALGALRSYAAALGCLFVGHFALYAAVVAFHATRDAAAEPAGRGKIYGAVSAVLAPAAVLSMIAGGAAADRFGPSAVFAASGAAALVGLGLIGAARPRSK